MIKAVFLARFHQAKGPIVTHQVPAGSVAASDEDRTSDKSGKSPTKPLVDFPLLSPYLLPPQTLCNRLLTLRSPTSQHVIISHPVCIVDDVRYQRNEYIFNFGIVVAVGGLKSSRGGLDAWRTIVRKVAAVLRGLEEDRQWLSKDELKIESGLARSSDSRVYALCEMIMEDLNCYGECMIPVDDSTTLSLRLSSRLHEAIPVSPWHVPVLLVNPTVLNTESWDLTLQLLLPFIDGIKHVSCVAQLADANLALACEAVRALVHNGCAILLDVFSFAASYAPTPDIGNFLEDQEAQDEARKYVLLPGYNKAYWYNDDLCRLLCSVQQGTSLRQWVLDRSDELSGVDVRRLITVGVLKGIIYRVHKYAVSVPRLAAPRAGVPVTLGQRIVPHCDGMHCFDQLCTELHASDEDVTRAVVDEEAQIVLR